MTYSSSNLQLLSNCTECSDVSPSHHRNKNIHTLSTEQYKTKWETSLLRQKTLSTRKDQLLIVISIQGWVSSFSLFSLILYYYTILMLLLRSVEYGSTEYRTFLHPHEMFEWESLAPFKLFPFDRTRKIADWFLSISNEGRELVLTLVPLNIPLGSFVSEEKYFETFFKRGSGGMKEWLTKGNGSTREGRNIWCHRNSFLQLSLSVTGTLEHLREHCQSFELS